MAKQLRLVIPDRGLSVPLKNCRTSDGSLIVTLTMTSKTREALVNLLTAGMIEAEDTEPGVFEDNLGTVSAKRRILPFDCRVEGRLGVWDLKMAAILDDSWLRADQLVMAVSKITRTDVGDETTDPDL